MKVPRPERPFRLGTRASPLAMAQAHLARDALIATHGWDVADVEVVPMVASGDRIQDRALADIGGKALWTRELDIALGAEVIDAAVHSMKDVETLRPDGFAIAAMLPRADVRDRLLGAPSIAELPPRARVGSASPRRQAQLLRQRPDLDIVLLRGNIGTRLSRIAAGEVAGTLLAAAGLDRLGMHDTGVPIPLDVMLPAPAQGAIGIEVRRDDESANAIVGAIDHAPTSSAVMAERALLLALGGSCHSPIAALARHDAEGRLWLDAEIYSADGAEHVAMRCPIDTIADAEALGRAMLAAAPPAVRTLFEG